jgi:hypothetical protein
MTNGRDGAGVSKYAARGGGWATGVLRMERGGMLVGTDDTGGGGTRVYMRGRRFSFPLDLLLMSADFFHMNPGMVPPLASLGEALSTQEKVLAKVKTVDTEAGRLDGCRAGACTAAATTGASCCWAAGTVVRPSPRPSWPLKKRSCLISADAGGVG